MSVNVKSQLITNFDSQPVVLSNPGLASASDVTNIDFCSVGSGDGAGSTYRFNFLPSNARIQDIQIMNDALTTGSSYKCGVALNTADGGGLPVAASDQIFFSGVSLVTAKAVWTSAYFPSIL